MDNNIDNLIDRYFEGETTLEEENLIRKYFDKKTIAKKHEEYAPIFRYFTAEREHMAQVGQTLTVPQKRRTLFFFKSSSIAACIIVALLIGIGKHKSQNASVVYINGEESRNFGVINTQALISIDNITSLNDETIDSQVEIIDSFLE